MSDTDAVTTWTLGEKNVIAVAAAVAPSVHNTQPWVLELHDDRHAAELFERLDRTLPHHDRLGRDRLISCGAAVEHVSLAMRALGWTPETTLYPEPERHDLVARVTATTRTEPSDVDFALYGAIKDRRSHRKLFASAPVDNAARRRLLAANHTDGVGLRPVTEPVELAALARLLIHSALVLRADHAYQQELSAWTSAARQPLPGDGVSAATRRRSTLPWAGLVRRTTAVPDLPTLVDRLSGEFLVIVETPDDGRADHVRAGMAAEQVWLAAVEAGLVGSLLTQPFQLPETRAGLMESLWLSGFPQLLLRIGHRPELGR